MPFFNSHTFSQLYRQTWPMLIGLFAIMGSQLADSAFIGQLGAEPLAVVGFSIPIYQLIIGIQVGLGIATTALISTALGSKKKQYAKYLGSLILIIGSIIITLVCLLLWYFQEKVALYLGADASLLTLLRSYWFPWLISCWLGALLYFGYGICRSYGETLIPGRVMVITSLLNLILDPIFIFTLDLKIAGAAWATCISFVIGCFIIFKAIFDKHLIMMPTDLNKSKNGITAIVRLTIPAMLSQFIPPISAMIVTIIIASYGDLAIGAWGLANRIEYISIILILALTMALPPMIGKLKGMNETAKILVLVKVALVFVMCFQFVLALIMSLLAPVISTLLTNQSEISTILQNYLWVVPLSYGALGVCMICVSACNAMSLPKSALLISMLRLFACYLPLIWIGSELYGLLGVFIGASIGNFLSGILAWNMFIKQYHKVDKSYFIGTTAKI